MMEPTTEELRIFFEALADLDRLKIVGELAKGNQQIQTLAEEIGMKPEKLATHLRKLTRTGVVTLKQLENGEPGYELDSDALEKMAKRQFAQAKKRHSEKDHRQIPEDFTEEERKILMNYTAPSGAIKQIPPQHKKQMVLLRYVLQHVCQALEPGKHYTEREVNAIFHQLHRDAAFFRRGLVDLGYLNRYADGSAYWLTEKALGTEVEYE